MIEVPDFGHCGSLWVGSWFRNVLVWPSIRKTGSRDIIYAVSVYQLAFDAGIRWRGFLGLPEPTATCDQPPTLVRFVLGKRFCKPMRRVPGFASIISNKSPNCSSGLWVRFCCGIKAIWYVVEKMDLETICTKEAELVAYCVISLKMSFWLNNHGPHGCFFTSWIALLSHQSKMCILLLVSIVSIPSRQQILLRWVTICTIS
jgi:hypothetical protein